MREARQRSRAWWRSVRGGARSGGPPGGGSMRAQAEQGGEGGEGRRRTGRSAGAAGRAVLLRPSPSSPPSPSPSRAPQQLPLLRASTSRCSFQVVSFCRSRSTTSDGARETNCSLPSFFSCDSTSREQPVHLGAQPAALPAHVDGVAQRDEHGGAVGEHGVAADALGRLSPKVRSDSLASRMMVARSCSSAARCRPALCRSPRRAPPGPAARHIPRGWRGWRRPAPAPARNRGGRRVLRPRIRPGPGSDRDRGVFRPAGKAPPERLGDERHDRVQQPQGDIERLSHHRPGHIATGLIAIEAGLDLLDVPVGEIAPDEAIDAAGRLVQAGSARRPRSPPPRWRHSGR